jgi:hypothetical protein
MTGAVTTGITGSGGLSREVLKWLQSLDLSYSVKDVKRDFANGFLIAEIFSRYYPNDVQLHAFDNGTKLATKNDNWDLLYLFFQKKKMPIGKVDFDSVLHCVPGASGVLLTKVYKIVTKRPVPTFKVSAPQKIAEQGSTLEPTQRPPGTAESMGASRLKFNQAEELDPADELALHTLGKGGGRASEARAVSQSVDVAPLDIKAIQMKPVRNANVTQLRAQSDMQQSHRSRAGTSASRRSDSPTNTPYGVVKPALDIMKTIINPVLQEVDPAIQARMDGSKDVVSAFLELCFAVILPESMSVQVFEALGHRAPLLAEGLLKAPTEYWKVWTLLRPGLVAYDESSPVFEALIFCLTRMGESMRELDETTLGSYFREMVLPQVAELMAASSGKREQLCELTLAYVSPASHVALLKVLKKLIPDLPTYIICLSHLCRADGLQGVMDELLLDLYIYYAMIALTHTAAKVRVAGLAILYSMVQIGQVNAVWNLIPELVNLATDPWWEVQAQLLLLVPIMIRTGRPHELAGEEELIMILQKIFGNANQSKTLLQVGLVGIARCLREVPQLTEHYVSILLAQPKALRDRLLVPQQSRIAYVMGPSSRLYEERGVVEQLPRFDIANIVMYKIEGAGLTRLEVEHCDLLAACIGKPWEPAPGPEEVEEWLGWYEKAKKYVLIALADPELHEAAKSITSAFWGSPHFSSKTLEMSVETLAKSMHVVFSATSDRVTVDNSEILAYLRAVKDRGEEQERFIRTVVDYFKVSYPNEYEVVNLQESLA